ncbi:DNA-binding response regulator, NarL/FixJ family, contains REC and HTH domains [Dyadobacter sp. SG02]|uniref:response regulator n=1 Tax=Dyadobacter sp. SG02 TaxID=1855291 RepID=UPI0008D3ED1A|nr:response regulator transcription factor [Dyadobacter sp. SG02]SEI54905.1 DNA-binding response regulator, NarL/FixJ family, contains REC and HTH domains [Dyadobacter sp. SG02]
MNRVLIADDHDIVRFGLTMLIQETFPGCTPDEAWNAESVMAMMKKNEYPLLLLDLVMPDTDPNALLHHIRHFHSDTRVLILSMNDESLYGARFIQLGAQGYIKKDAPKDEIKKAIHTVLAGKKYVSQELGEVLVQDSLDGKKGNPFERLSAREFQVAMHLVQGYSQKQISEMLQVQYGTVNTLKQRLFEKLNIEHHKDLNELSLIYGL